MQTYVCRWCRNTYLPKQGAIRSYYCSRSCKEKYYREQKNQEQNRKNAAQLFSVSQLRSLIDNTAQNEPSAKRHAIQALGCVDPLRQQWVMSSMYLMLKAVLIGGE